MSTTPIPIEVVDYDPGWPEIFGKLRDVYIGQLGPLAERIEHVGSTSVPGLAAKPVIDINIVISSYDKFEAVKKLLMELGYHYEGEKGVPDRHAFGRKTKDVPRTPEGLMWMPHHLYVCPSFSAELKRQLLFRDYLRAHPQAAQEYGELKKRLAVTYRNDRPGYSNAKTDFVLSIMSLADRSFRK